MAMSYWKNLGCCLTVLLSAAVAAAGGENDTQTPAERIRAVLDQPTTLDNTFNDAKALAKFLSDKTGFKFIVDRNLGAGLEPSNFELKAEKTKLSAALRRCLARHALAFVVLEDTVAISSEELAPNLQVRQIVSLRLKDVPLNKALKDLGRATPFNVVINPRVAKEAQTPVSMELENIPLFMAVRLMTELAGLKAVPIHNAMMITSKEHTDKLLAEEKASRRNDSPWAPPSYGSPPVYQYYPPPPPLAFPGPGPETPPGPLPPGAPPQAVRQVSGPEVLQWNNPWVKVKVGINFSYQSGGVNNPPSVAGTGNPVPPAAPAALPVPGEPTSKRMPLPR